MRYDVLEASSELLRCKFDLDPQKDLKKIASCIQHLSDYYIADPDAPTPWEKKETQIAYLAYYYPLNYYRAKHLLQGIQNEYPKFSFSHHVDFGSGLGSMSQALAEIYPIKTYSHIELAKEAIDLHEALLASSQNHSWLHRPEKLLQDSLFTTSYSITENNLDLIQSIEADHFLLLEPGTKKDFPQLKELRKYFLEKGYQVLAPCTHQLACPMGKRDWCHMSFAMDLPEYFEDLEQHFPADNHKLHYSYLFLSKQLSNQNTDKVRVIGDPLKEKGKMRQMICRGEEREFLSQLKKHGSDLNYSKGELIGISEEDYEKKGNEWRRKI